MKVVAIALALGTLQFFFDQTTESIDNALGPRKIRREVEVVNERWECSGCGHENGDWTSICGRCGRSNY